MENSFKRLKDGSWGIRVVDPRPQSGDHVMVKKKDGSEDEVRLGRMVFEAEDGSIRLFARSTS